MVLLPDPDTPITISTQGILSESSPTKILRQRRLIHEQIVSSMACARLAGRFSPSSTRVKIARLSAPEISNSISRQELSAGSVSVTRATNGSTLAVGTPTTQRSAPSTAGESGKKDGGDR